ncbi:MAG TPA: hypothetical protein VND24_01400 [Steroidobacteraceae bacterium]|nr:hypothetical protein [Steroidobacteraceae bacterium]
MKRYKHHDLILGATPVTYRIVGFLQRSEHEDYFDRDADSTPFSLSIGEARTTQRALARAA